MNSAGGHTTEITLGTLSIDHTWTLQPNIEGKKFENFGWNIENYEFWDIFYIWSLVLAFMGSVGGHTAETTCNTSFTVHNSGL